MNEILVYDTTMRDGSQGEGVNFSMEDKLRLAHALDDLGVQYIEGGWPGSNPKDIEFFAALRKEKFKTSRIAAFGSTRRMANSPDKDPFLRQLVESGAPVAAIFGKSWDLHVREALRVELKDNLAMIESSVRFLKGRMEKVFFDAEHFFDGFAANPEYAMQALDAAVQGGADALVLCDTNGGRLPHEIGDVVQRMAEKFSGMLFGIHCHNDSGLALANTLEAVRRGARMVQGCMNGFGERTGNADLCQVLPNLELKMGYRCLGPENMRRLTRVSRFTYELANTPQRDFQPFVGRSAFAHKGGIHVSAVARNPLTYEHIDPEAVGNGRRILVSELSGRSNILALSPVKLDDVKMRLALNKIMALEKEGYAFENASASFELLLYGMVGEYQPGFEMLTFRAITEAKPEMSCVSESSVKMRIGPVELHTVAEAENGPVSAMDNALRKALEHVYPYILDLRLTDYRVHIVNAQAGTAARVRVVIESEYKGERWGTVGVSDNILVASCQAMEDSYQYLIFKNGGRRSAIWRERLHSLPGENAE